MAILGLNKEVLDKAIKVLGLQSAVEKLPVTMEPTIQPTLDLNPERIVTIVAEKSNNGTIYTVPEKGEFFLTNAQISSFSSSQGASVSDIITAVIDNGKSIGIMRMQNGSGATDSNTAVMVSNFTTPIKLLPSSIISFTRASTASTGSIMGYLVDG